MVRLAEAANIFTKLDMRMLIDVEGNAVWVNEANVDKWLKHNKGSARAPRAKSASSNSHGAAASGGGLCALIKCLPK